MPSVTILYFASLRDRLQCEREQLDLPAQAESSEVLQAISRKHPEAADLLATCRLAVDCTFATGRVALSERSEVAVIPPVSGG
jgi:molybdopterin converting factor subunit 1